MTERTRSDPDPFAPGHVDLRRLPASCRVGTGLRLFAGKLDVGEDVVLGDGVTVVGDEVVIGAGTRIGRGSDLRAGSLVIGERSEIAVDVRVLVADSFRLGMASRVCSEVDIVCRDFSAGRLLYLGDGTSVGYGGTTASTARVKIGRHVTIGQHSILNANHLIEIGDDVGTGSYLALWTHGYHFGHGPLDGFEPAYAPVRVGANAWLGFRVTVLPGITVGENSILAAGSVVTADIPSNVLAAGVPAVVKKPLTLESVGRDSAHAAVVRVLRTWQAELEWKGCPVSDVLHEPRCSQMTVALPDGTCRTRVVLVAPDQPLPKRAGGDEKLAIVSVEDRREAQTVVDGDTNVFQLRSGELLGKGTPVVEDLRDQLRRHAMPCGDDRCFSSIEPRRFGRLRSVIPERTGSGDPPPGGRGGSP